MPGLRGRSHSKHTVLAAASLIKSTQAPFAFGRWRPRPCLGWGLSMGPYPEMVYNDGKRGFQIRGPCEGPMVWVKTVCPSTRFPSANLRGRTRFFFCWCMNMCNEIPKPRELERQGGPHAVALPQRCKHPRPKSTLTTPGYNFLIQKPHDSLHLGTSEP